MDGKRVFLPLCWLVLSWIFLHDSRAASAQPTLSDTSLKAVEVNGTVLRYTEEGKGAPVVFVHGSFGDYRTWH